MSKVTQLKRRFRKKGGVVKKTADKEAKKLIARYVGDIRKFSIPKKVLDIFPRVMRNLHGRMTASDTISLATNREIAFKGNSFHTAGPAINNSGSFTTNVPAGLYNLFSSNAASGSVAPYSLARILGSRITIRIVNLGASNTTGMKIVVWPSQGPTSSGMSFEQAVEQRKAKFKYIPALTNTSEIVISNQSSTWEFVGVPETQICALSYAHNPTNDPINVWYWQIIMQAADGSATNQSYNIQYNIDYQFDVLERNQLPTTVPS